MEATSGHAATPGGSRDMKKTPLFKMFASLKLAVFSILSLAAVLAYATMMESNYGMRAAHVMVYGTWWFTGVLFLLGTNVFCAALSRFPWKRHQTGFVITHLGILTLLAGSYITQQWGIDGNLAVVEKTQGNEVILNDLALDVFDEGGHLRKEVPMPETGTLSEGNLLQLDVSPSRRIVVDKFLPRIASEKAVLASPIPGLGVPALRIQLFNSRFRVREWLFSAHPEQPTEVNLGPAVLSLRKLWSEADEKEFLRKDPPKAKPTTKIGYLIIQKDGKEIRVFIDDALKGWRPLVSTDLELKVERYLPFAIVKDNQLVNKTNDPGNPAVQVLVRDKEGDIEKHTLFANFPEFNTLHHGRSIGNKHFGLKFKMISTAGKPTESNPELSLVGSKRGQLQFAVTADNKRLLYRSFAAAGTVNGVGEVHTGAEVLTGWMDLKFIVTQWFPTAIREEKPRYIEYISGGESNYLSGIRYQDVSLHAPTNASAEEGQGRWILEGEVSPLPLGSETWALQYTKRRLVLPFSLFLQKFTVGMDPGTTKAAAYESNVVVKNAPDGQEIKALISMNEPLKYGGYTFYQASYQAEEGKPPVSVFSVNHDPGRPVKYAGTLIMVLGIISMFWMNPHYWGIILGRGGGK
jgi:hypothetical protein